MKRIVPGSIAVLLAWGLLGSGCRKKDSPPPVDPGQQAQTNTVAEQISQAKTAPAAATNSVDQKVTQLLNTFENAPATTRTRVQTAVDSLRAGKEREAVVQLKLIDADSDLTAEQVQSIKDLIITVRKK